MLCFSLKEIPSFARFGDFLSTAYRSVNEGFQNTLKDYLTCVAKNFNESEVDFNVSNEKFSVAESMSSALEWTP